MALEHAQAEISSAASVAFEHYPQSLRVSFQEVSAKFRPGVPLT